MDDEDKSRYLSGISKLERKNHLKKVEADLEDLAPKATGRDAMIEKRKSLAAYHKQERDVDIDFKDADIMGGGDDFKSHLAREKKRKEMKEERKKARTGLMEDKINQFNAKESQTMSYLHELAKKFQ